MLLFQYGEQVETLKKCEIRKGLDWFNTRPLKCALIPIWGTGGDIKIIISCRNTHRNKLLQLSYTRRR